MGMAILASAFLVLELGALVIYNGIKTCLEGGEVAGRRGGTGYFTKVALKNTNT